MRRRIRRTIRIAATYSADDCTVRATLRASDGSDDAVHVYDYDGDSRTYGQRLHTFDDPAGQVGESVSVSVPRKSELAVGLDRSGAVEITQIYLVSPSR